MENKVIRNLELSPSSYFSYVRFLELMDGEDGLRPAIITSLGKTGTTGGLRRPGQC